MEKVKWMFVLLCAISLALVAVGCDTGPFPGPGPVPGGCGGTSTSSSSSSTSSGGSSGSMILDRTHSGWMRPNCANCHPGDSHNSGLMPYECVNCHGNNGATRVPHGGSNCQGCHRIVLGHPAATFPQSESCIACHK